MLWSDTGSELDLQQLKLSMCFEIIPQCTAKVLWIADCTLHENPAWKMSGQSCSYCSVWFKKDSEGLLCKHAGVKCPTPLPGQEKDERRNYGDLRQKICPRGEWTGSLELTKKLTSLIAMCGIWAAHLSPVMGYLPPDFEKLLIPSWGSRVLLVMTDVLVNYEFYSITLS